MNALERLLKVSDVHLSGLTDKQTAFVRSYAESDNVVESALSAGYSEQSAKSAAAAVMGSDRVRAAIAIERAKIVPTAAASLTENHLAQVLLQVALYGSPDTARVAAVKELRVLKGWGNERKDRARIGTINIQFNGSPGDNLKDIRRAVSAAELSTAEDATITAETGAE